MTTPSYTTLWDTTRTRFRPIITAMHSRQLTDRGIARSELATRSAAPACKPTDVYEDFMTGSVVDKDCVGADNGLVVALDGVLLVSDDA